MGGRMGGRHNETFKRFIVLFITALVIISLSLLLFSLSPTDSPLLSSPLHSLINPLRCICLTSSVLVSVVSSPPVMSPGYLSVF